ncbi:MAG: NGG1p interacting factor NIF3 [Candidatus Omnitrophica bacterium]|nr:NGG1p interacting factor NIF3 [Candidatus Omnitrophota bacterium]
MKLSEFYKQVVSFGIEHDPRKRRAIKSYEDTAILYGNPDTEISRVMIGIDIDVAELLLADQIRKEEGLDLVISHHPEGVAYACLPQVMRLQIDILVKAGISRRVAEQLLQERMREVERKVLPANHMRAVDAARLLDLPFMCVHTPADNHVSYFIQKLIATKRPHTIQDLIDILREIPEDKEAERNGSGPRIFLGSPHRPVGKVFVEMTGGTEGSREAYDKLNKRGIRTIVAMHLSEEHFKKVNDVSLNVIIAGHISSDTLGLNLLLDRIEKKNSQRFTVYNCSGFRRIRRID